MGPNACGPPAPRRIETLAARHLEEEGWTIVERNVRWRRKEVDLVVRRGSVVAFVGAVIVRWLLELVAPRPR